VNQENALLDSTFFEIVVNQINIALVLIGRPVVQRQMVVLGLIILLALVLPEFARRLLNHRYPPAQKETLASWRRWLANLQPLYAPAISLLLTLATTIMFYARGYPTGLLTSFLALLSIWLGYRALVLGLQLRFGKASLPYRRWVLGPIFIALIAIRILGGSVGFDLLFAVPVFVFSTGEVLTLGNMVIAFFTFYAFAVLSWIAEQAINHALSDRLHAEPGMIQSVATLTRYTIIALGIVVSLATLGFNATSLALVAGGLSVGIGIGMQDIVANFVSGLTLLFEQSLRPGDIIELEGRISRVERVSLRTTTVRTLDNLELIIPNATFTTAQVSSLTKSDRKVRARLPFGVSYDSDPRQVQEVAIATAVANDMVLSTPMPSVLFRGFGDSSLDFELAIWIEQPQQRERIKSTLYYQLWTAFKENGIEIPFPQRDLNLGRGWAEFMTGHREEDPSPGQQMIDPT
jgi:potassium-dependent mechanosensitive channel